MKARITMIVIIAMNWECWLLITFTKNFSVLPQLGVFSLNFGELNTFFVYKSISMLINKERLFQLLQTQCIVLLQN